MKAVIISLLLLALIYNPENTLQMENTVDGILYSDGKPVSLVIENGKIIDVRRQVLKTNSSKIYVAPGLIDMQINGYIGVDFSGPGLTVEGVKKATKALWKAGVTSYFPTLITSDIDRIKKNMAILAKAKEDPEIGKSIPGFHLEGPYISPVKGFRGAHLAKYIKLPDWDEFQGIQKAANNQIKVITLAPELKGAIPFIRKCVNSGVVVSLGHHNGSSSDILKAVEAGAKMATHLGNGCANQINRHHNPIWPQLSNDGLTASFIVDGFHLTKEEVRSFYKAKGVENSILVSDALDLAGLPPGEYTRGERTLLLTPDVVKLPKEDVLAGAASPISKCVGVMIDFTQCSLQEAIQMASGNPAKMFELKNLGKIQKGKSANLILFTLKDNEMVIKKTFIEGELVYSQDW